MFIVSQNVIKIPTVNMLMVSNWDFILCNICRTHLQNIIFYFIFILLYFNTVVSCMQKYMLKKVYGIQYLQGFTKAFNIFLIMKKLKIFKAFQKWNTVHE